LRHEEIIFGRYIKVFESSHSTGVLTGGSQTSFIREHEMQRILHFSSENQSFIDFHESKYSAPTTNERPDRREHARN